MEEDTSYTKLPVEERCVHKLWKARVDGYEEAAKLFKQIDDENDPEWNKYLGLIKKFVIDSHAMAQERGLEATLVYVEMANVAGKTVGEVMSGLVTKCMGSPKAKIKDLAAQIALMYIEIEKQDAVIDELVKGLDNKNPKIVSACVSLATRSLREYGRTVITLKPLVKKIAALLGDRDKNVRDETKLLTVEMFRWIGPALKPQLTSLNEVMLKELEGEFEKVKDEHPQPIRFLRSQQAKAATARETEEASGENDDDVADGGNDQKEIDPMDLIDPVEILSKIPKDFYDKLESKKWQERKESLEALDVLLQNPKLESGDYGDLVRALKKVLTKDTNVVLVAMAGKAIAQLARGLSKKFNTYAGALIGGIFEKFKEKKSNVVASLRDAIDAIYPATTLEAIQEDLLEALNNKNPSVKSETCLFLARALTKTQPSVLNKKLLKTIVSALLKTLNEPDPTVRDGAAEALGTAMKLVGEKVMAPCLTDVDALKMNKIKECCDKAEITVKIEAAPVAKKSRPVTAPNSASATTGRDGGNQPKPVTRPATGSAPKKVIGGGGAAVKKSMPTGSSVSKSASSAKITGNSKQLPTERDLSAEDVDEKVLELLPADVVQGLVDANWKSRLSAVESMAVFINDLDNKNNTSQILVRTLAKKPGFKDTNFQVLKGRFDVLRSIVETMTITATTADYIINDVVEKLGDLKNGASAGQALTAIAESISLEYAVTKTLAFIFEQKSPKVQQEGLLWISNAIREFGFQLQPKVMIDDAKKAVQSINPAVRGAGITLLGTMYLYMGAPLANFFDGEKPALKAQIDTEFQKNQGQQPPAPTRGAKANGADSGGGGENDDGVAEMVPEVNLSDLLPRIDIAPMMTESLLNDIGDKNWKTRNEGLTKLQNILDESKLIKPTLGDLPPALVPRIKDSNTKIAQLAINICEQLAVCMGSHFKQHIKVFLPGILAGLGDSKTFLKQACASCIQTWGSTCGYKEFFECEMISEALKTGGPGMRVELWGWLGEKLPEMAPKTVPKDELLACIPYLFANICDRNADVRKNANDAILGFMLHIGYDAMAKIMDKQAPAMKKDIRAALDKVRPMLPAKPLAKSKSQANVDEPAARAPQKLAGGGGSGANASKLVKPGASKAAADKPVVSRKKEEEVDTSPLLAVNNIKHQRMIDEQKLRVLKWQFTQPREEFTELLKEQMYTANVNKTLIGNMFHDDFRYHLKVIDALIDDLPSNDKGLTSNLDLVLKWLSLRFYDTNPSVLIKGLDYLLSVADMLVANSYSLTDIEANSFIPHLLIKIGDPKDTVKNGVRNLLRRFRQIYPYAKLFTFIMDGLKSKNARQRTECLDELGDLICVYGVSTMTPSPTVALKEVAKQISDRDNSVRNAALNCIVQAYFLVGEKVYKLIGQISDKDMSMLDERIKRAKKTRPAYEAAAAQQQQQQQQIMMKPVKADPIEEMQEAVVVEEEEPEAGVEEEEEKKAESSPAPLAGLHRNRSGKIARVLPAVRQVPLDATYREERRNDANEQFRGQIDYGDYEDDEEVDDDAAEFEGGEVREADEDGYQGDEVYEEDEEYYDGEEEEEYEEGEEEETEEEEEPVPAPPQPTGPFGLDMNYINEIERGWVKVNDLPHRRAADVDISFLYSPLKLYEVNGATYPEDKLKQLITKSMAENPYMVSPPAMKTPGGGYLSKVTTNRNLMNHLNDMNMSLSPKPTIALTPPAMVRNLDPNIVRKVKGVGVADLYVAQASMKELNDLLESEDKHAVLIDYEEMYVGALLQQFQHLATLPLQDTLIIYQHLLYNVYLYMSAKTLCKRLSVASLKDLMDVLLGLLSETKLAPASEPTGYPKVINGICVKVLDHANFTAINCALIGLLRESCLKSTLPKFTDLLMKCVWRNVKMMHDRVTELDPTAILLESHKFLVALPPTWWQQRPSDTPLRTIRTLIHNLVKIRNINILDDIPKDIPQNSELRSYVNRIVRSINMGPDNKMATQTPPEEGSDFWLKRLKEFNAENNVGGLAGIGGAGVVGVDLPNAPQPNYVGRTNLLQQQEEDTNRAAYNSIREELAKVTDPAARVDFLKEKVAQIQMEKINRR